MHYDKNIKLLTLIQQQSKVFVEKIKGGLEMNNLDWAVKYAEHGFSVIPTNVNLKSPAIPHSNKPSLTDKEITQLWTDNPNLGIAWKMTNIFSIDIDTPKHSGKTKIDGFKSIRESIPVEWLPDTLTALTPNDGLHLYYLKKDGQPNKTKAGFLPGVDIQAEQGNISLVPPTLLNGVSYEWVNPDQPVVEAPTELIEFIQQKTQKGIKTKKHYYGRKTWTGCLLDELFYPQIVGKRNDYLTHIIGKLFKTGARAETIYQLAIIANNQFQEPLPKNEVTRTFNSILEREVNNIA